MTHVNQRPKVVYLKNSSGHVLDFWEGLPGEDAFIEKTLHEQVSLGLNPPGKSVYIIKTSNWNECLKAQGATDVHDGTELVVSSLNNPYRCYTIGRVVLTPGLYLVQKEKE